MHNFTLPVRNRVSYGYDKCKYAYTSPLQWSYILDLLPTAMAGRLAVVNCALPSKAEKDADLYTNLFGDNVHKRHCYPQPRYTNSGAFTVNGDPI